MEKELVKVDAAEFGIEESKAAQIKEQFSPMLDKMVGLEKDANIVFKLDIEAPDTATIAKELRLKYVKVRTGTAAIHKEQKSFYLKAGKYIDGWKNAQLFASSGIEEKLMAIEKHAEIKAAKARQQLTEKRAWELRANGVMEEPHGLGNMTEEVWGHYINGVKENNRLQKEAEAKAKIEAEEREKKEAAEREQMRLDNIRLREEAQERERLATIEADRLERERNETARLARIEAEKREAEIVKKQEADAAKWKAQQDKYEAEKEAREKVEAELRKKRDAETAERIAKQEAEEKAAQLILDKKEVELAKGDEDYKRDLNLDLQLIIDGFEFKSEKNKKMHEGVKGLIEKVIVFVNK